MRAVEYLLFGVTAIIIFIGLILVCGFTGMIIGSLIFPKSVVFAVLGFVIGGIVGFVFALLAIWWVWKKAKEGLFDIF